MRTKLIIGFIAVAVIALAGWNINKSQNEVFVSELALANVEALAGGEIVIECDNSSMAIRCQKTCLSCGTVWTAIGGYGLSGKMKGECKCGALYY
ncbi:hypothetical protein H8788_03815 [Parabacteroides faecis]|uniref:NVEALA domain-containing protein n=1 Tax=Parabacteroides TaxID=375288 RepID=UPI000EFE809B|nr:MULTISPECIES: NVEALA domain-containing protein [Parabacteroides]MBC8616855.1 hypothetical protein [Parabacteroides faecis]RHR98251.1 hypothetical protein DWW23_12290 [Parabacteroides sp. AF14-59]